jgi:proteasome lid subunit RPN8/RPN11
MTAISTIDSKRSQLTKRRQRLLLQFQDAANAGKRSRLSVLFERIHQTNDFLACLSRIEEENGKSALKPGVPRFTVSSLFLYECFKKLTADKDEQFSFITGSEIEGRLVLDQMIDLEHQTRSYVGVTAEPKSTHRALIKLVQFGHRLLAHFHSHPGNGAGSTRPSGIDEAFQKRLESAGHIAVMAIFSRDGFIRFLRLDGKFEIEIFGEGVERHEGNVFRLTQADPSNR